MADNLQPESLSWALSHVQRFGDTDIFPTPFEYNAIAHNWNAIGIHLEQIDLSSHRVSSDRRVMVVKPGGGFRAAIQLDPLDQLLYTAAVYECADLVEKNRIPPDQKVACSYRVKLSPKGEFFAPDNGWKDFHLQSRALGQLGRYSHVLSVDISDFYNQLGQHRVQNALEMATVSADRSKNIEHFLNQLTAKQSQGLPVGPFASIVLAEGCLTDVDNFLRRLDVEHVRYVDDFRIFCKSRKHGVDLRHSLSEYLFNVHRLSLESSKSSLKTVFDFFMEELSDPEETEKQAQADKLSERLNRIAEEYNQYSFGDLDLPEQSEILSEVEQECLIELFERCVQEPPLQLGLARHLLRKARASRTVVLNNLVFANLENLAPAMRDVVRYLITTIPKSRAASRGKEILEFCATSDLGDVPFVRMWMLELLIQRPDMCGFSDALQNAEKMHSVFGLRPCALLAVAHKQIDWIRGKKETWRNHEKWDKRALIWSSSLLPSGERKPFLNMVVQQGDILDSAVAKHLLGQT